MVVVVVGVALLLAGQWQPAAVANTAQKSWTLSHRVLKNDIINADADADADADDSSSTSVSAWSLRGTMELRWLANNNYNNNNNNNEDALPELTIVNAPLSETLLQAIPDDTAFYQIRIDENSSSGTSGSSILTTIPACHVRRANFRDEIALSLNDQAEILSLSYDPLISPLAPKSCSAYFETASATTGDTTTTATTTAGKKQFETKVSFSIGQVGMTVGYPTTSSSRDGNHIKPPPGLKWLPGPKGGGIAAGKLGDTADDPAKAEPKGPFDFIKRYWYVFLPILIMNLMASDTKPLPTPEGDTTPAPTMAPSNNNNINSNEPKRRGKRG